MRVRANERNAKLALAFHSDCSRDSITRSVVKSGMVKVKTMVNNTLCVLKD